MGFLSFFFYVFGGSEVFFSPVEAHVRWNDEQQQQQQPSRKCKEAWEELSEWLVNAQQIVPEMGVPKEVSSTQ